MGGGSFRDESVSDFFECAKEVDHGLGVQFAVLEKVVAETFVFAGGEVPELRCREGTRGGVAVLDLQVRIVGAREGREDTLEGSATVLVTVVEPEIPEGNEEVHGAFRNPSDPGLPGERCRTLTEAAVLKRGILGDHRALPGLGLAVERTGNTERKLHCRVSVAERSALANRLPESRR